MIEIDIHAVAAGREIEPDVWLICPSIGDAIEHHAAAETMLASLPDHPHDREEWLTLMRDIAECGSRVGRLLTCIGREKLMTPHTHCSLGNPAKH